MRVELLSVKWKLLSQVAGARIAVCSCSGKINHKADNIILKSENWRMNLLSPNTEPLLQLNLETRGDRVAVRENVHIVESLIGTQA